MISLDSFNKSENIYNSNEQMFFQSAQISILPGKNYMFSHKKPRKFDEKNYVNTPLIDNLFGRNKYL